MNRVYVSGRLSAGVCSRVLRRVEHRPGPREFVRSFGGVVAPTEGEYRSHHRSTRDARAQHAQKAAAGRSRSTVIVKFRHDCNYSMIVLKSPKIVSAALSGVNRSYRPVTVQGCGGGVIASAARQSRWGNRFLQDRRGCYGVEIATAQAPRNDDLLNSEQLH